MKVQEIERAIGELSPSEIDELYTWLEEHWESRVKSDLAAGRLDAAIERALDDEKQGRVREVLASKLG